MKVGVNIGKALTKNQEDFVLGIYDGLSQREAYRRAYPNWKGKDNTTDQRASRLFANSKIGARLTELRQQVIDARIWTVEMASDELIWLKNQAKEGIKEKGIQMANSQAFIRSVEELNKINHLYEPEHKEKLLIRKLEAEIKDKEAKAQIAEATAKELTNSSAEETGTIIVESYDEMAKFLKEREAKNESH